MGDTDAKGSIGRCEMAPPTPEQWNLATIVVISTFGSLWYAQTHETTLAKVLRYIFYMILPALVLATIIAGYVLKMVKH